MQAFRTLIQASRRQLILAVACSVVAGLCSVLLIGIINNTVTASTPRTLWLAFVFAVTALGMVAFRMLAGVLFTRLSQETLVRLRAGICRSVLRAAYRKVEVVGPARIHSLLTDDSAAVAAFFSGLPSLLLSAMVVGGCFIYLAVLSLPVFAVACVLVVVGSLGYHSIHSRVVKHLRAASRQQDALFEQFDALTGGLKELKLNRRRASAFLSTRLERCLEAVRSSRVRGLALYGVATSSGNFLFFIFIGVVLFALDGASADQRVATGYAIVFLYLIAPIENLLNSIPTLNLARVSLERISRMQDELRATEVELSDAEAPFASPMSIELRGLTHSYYREQDDGIFELGPIDLHFRAGEITFLVGGNGCGKTTLAKLIVGLYAPERGEIFHNNEAVTDANRDRYRQSFAAVFSDFYLFDSLTGAAAADVHAPGNALLAKLQLNHKVSIRDGAFSTRQLSQGQRKRLALIVAWLEERPFLVFDEWAADQDPVFKDVFYREILPQLRDLGKAVLVISHDDRYFSLADRVVRMENGRIVNQY